MELTLNNKDNWRLPSALELMQIISGDTPSHTYKIFQNLQGLYWTSYKYIDNSSIFVFREKATAFNYGGLNTYDFNTMISVPAVCVRWNLLDD